MRSAVFIVVISAALAATAQDVNTKPAPKSKAPIQSHETGESSSKDTMIDISPPKGDATAHPNSEVPDVGELHPYNPMKAMKNVEVGNYYFTQRNYVAAISRYREALEYKPHDVVATFALAQALEKTKDYAGARANYQDYLRILPEGPKAEDCKKALDRIARLEKPRSR